MKKAAEVQNITLALPRPLLRKAKHLAVERQTSVSRLLAEALTEVVEREDAYARARNRALADLESGVDMKTRGRTGWTRDDLHER